MRFDKLNMTKENLFDIFSNLSVMCDVFLKVHYFVKRLTLHLIKSKKILPQLLFKESNSEVAVV